MADAALSSWRFYKIGLLVTGKGEERFLPALLRAITSTGTCNVTVVRRIGQRRPITAPKRKLEMVGTGKVIPTRDEEEIGLPARKWLTDDSSKLLLLIDDLEHDWREAIRDVFRRYRTALDTLLRPEQRARASVHFLCTSSSTCSRPTTSRTRPRSTPCSARAW
jgi:hypothetical protein